jgi:hypothetical protein
VDVPAVELSPLATGIAMDVVNLKSLKVTYNSFSKVYRFKETVSPV